MPTLMMPLPLLAGTTLPFLNEMVALFVASVLIAYLCYRIKVVPIVGFLLAGVAIGPGALGLVTDLELINSTAEIGVILLLFTIGVEFSLAKLSRIGRAIFVGGGMQVGLTIGIVVAILLAFGVDWRAGFYTGCLVALSSTAIVLSLLADRQETDTPNGQLSLAILIFQDLAIIVMVLLVPVFAGQGESTLTILLTLGEAILIIVLVLVLARTLVPRLLEMIAQTQRSELFLLTIVTICFGTAWLTSLADVSLALGAFLAGLVVSESRYSEHALSEILPLRTIFNAIFFVSVGMLMDVNFFIQNLPLVLAVAAGVLLLKGVLTTATVLALGYPLRIAAVVGLTLAQIGEFSFVLERAGNVVGLSPAGLGTAGEQTFIAVSVLLMLLTPMGVGLGPKLSAWLGRFAKDDGTSTDDANDHGDHHYEDHVLVVGYGPAGQRLVRVLSDTGIPFIILELNPQLADKALKENYPVLIGDATRGHLLEHAGLRRAKMCVVAINDPVATLRVTELAHYLNPTLQIIVRSRFLSDVERFHEAGADIVVPEELETAIRIFTHVLGAYMVPRDEIDRQVSAIRSGDYEVFRSRLHEAHLMVLQGLDEEGLHTRAVAVREGAPVIGQTLSDLALRQKYQLTVLAVRRQGRTIGNPAGDFRIAAGDRLVMVGNADQFAESSALFRERELPPVHEDVPV